MGPRNSRACPVPALGPLPALRSLAQEIKQRHFQRLIRGKPFVVHSQFPAGGLDAGRVALQQRYCLNIALREPVHQRPRCIGWGSRRADKLCNFLNGSGKRSDNSPAS